MSEKSSPQGSSSKSVRSILLAGAAAIGSWFGVGPERGMALVFTIAGLVGLIVTIIAFNSRYYRDLSAAYARTPDQPDSEAEGAPAQ